MARSFEDILREKDPEAYQKRVSGGTAVTPAVSDTDIPSYSAEYQPVETSISDIDRRVQAKKSEKKLESEKAAETRAGQKEFYDLMQGSQEAYERATKPSFLEQLIETAKRTPGATWDLTKSLPGGAFKAAEGAVTFPIKAVKKIGSKAKEYSEDPSEITEDLSQLWGEVSHPFAYAQGFTRGAVESLPGITTMQDETGQPAPIYPSLTEEEARGTSQEEMEDYARQAARARKLGHFLGLAGQSAIGGGAGGALGNVMGRGLSKIPLLGKLAPLAKSGAVYTGTAIPYSAELAEEDRPGEDIAADFILGWLTDKALEPFVKYGVEKVGKGVSKARYGKEATDLSNRITTTQKLDKPVTIAGEKFNPPIDIPSPQQGIVGAGIKTASNIKEWIDRNVQDALQKISPRDKTILAMDITPQEIKQGAVSFPEHLTAAEFAIANPLNPTPIDVAVSRGRTALNKLSSEVQRRGKVIDEFINKHAKAPFIGGQELYQDFLNDLKKKYKITIDNNGNLVPGPINILEDEMKFLNEANVLLSNLNSTGVTVEEAYNVRRALDKKLNFNKLSRQTPVNTEAEAFVKQYREPINLGISINRPVVYTIGPGGLPEFEYNKSFLDNLAEYSEAVSARDYLSSGLGGDKGSGLAVGGPGLMKAVAVSGSDRGTKKMFETIKNMTGIDLAREALYAELAMRMVGDTRINDLLRNTSEALITSKYVGPLGVLGIIPEQKYVAPTTKTAIRAYSAAHPEFKPRSLMENIGQPVPPAPEWFQYYPANQREEAIKRFIQESGGR